MWRILHDSGGCAAWLNGRILPVVEHGVPYQQEIANSVHEGKLRPIECDERCCDNCGMSNRTREIFDAIHRAPASGRQVLALSRADAEQLPLIEGVAMISITAPERPPAQLPVYPFLLRMSFADVDFLSTDLSERARAKLPDSMTKRQAAAILDFSKSLPDSVRTLLVHCEGGLSRSCGVAAALGEIFKFDVEERRLGDANPSVKKLLLQEAKGYKKGRRGR